MHVCHFCESTVEGAYFKDLTKGLIDKGIKVSLIELGLYKPPTWLNQIPEARYFNLGVTSKSKYPLAIWRLAQFLKREKIDILQTHLYYAGFIGVLAKQLHPKTIVVLTRHHTSIVRMLGKNYHLILDKWMAEKADYVIAVSEATKNYMQLVDGIRGNHIERIYLGFDFEKMAPNKTEGERVRKELGLSENDFIIGYIGHFASGKGQLQLVEAFSKIVGDIPHARLLLVGGKSSAEVNEAVNRLSLQELVIFTGWRADVNACLNAMDLFVQPSLSEAFSQVLVEAMGVGLPVIATNVGGASEVIKDGENGFLIEPNNIDAIYEKVIQIYNQPKFAREMALAGQDHVRQNYTIERLVNSQYNLYIKCFNLIKDGSH